MVSTTITASSSRPTLWVSFAIFISLFLLTLFLQFHNGAFSNDFGAHSDEASHVVTGLMVRDYLAGPIWHLEHPMRFAQTYYEHFPKVALGHYPPGFYALEGLWTLPSRSKTAIILLMTTLTALTAFIIWLVGRRFLPPITAFLAAATFLLIPLVQTYTTIVMSDMLLVIFCLLATLSWGRFIETHNIRYSWLFGLLAAAAILTKGSGLMLALVPPITIVFTRQFRLLTNWRLWVAPIPVLALALPWMLATRHITDEGMQHVPLSEYIPGAISYYLKAIPQTFGYLLTLLLILSFALPFLRRKTQLPTYYSLFSAFLFSILLFYIIVPSGLDTRYLLPALPFTILLAFSLIQKLSTHLKAPKISLITLIFSILIALENGLPAKKVYTGSHQSLEAIIPAPSQIQDPDKDDRIVILISSDSKGEGALIAEGCLYWPDTLSFRRASKVLAQSDWLGRDYQSTYKTPAQLSTYLLDQVDFVILDTGIPQHQTLPHHTLLQSTLSQTPSKSITQLPSIPSQRKHALPAQFHVYKLPNS